MAKRIASLWLGFRGTKEVEGLKNGNSASALRVLRDQTWRTVFCDQYAIPSCLDFPKPCRP